MTAPTPGPPSSRKGAPAKRPCGQVGRRGCAVAQGLVKPAVWIIRVRAIGRRRSRVVRRSRAGRGSADHGTRRDTGSDPTPTWTGIAAAVIAAARNVDIAVNVCGVDVGAVDVGAVNVGAVNVGGVDATVARGNAGPVAASGSSTAIGPACITAARSSGIPAAG